MTKLYTKTENAVAAGYAEFNRVPTLAVDVPDGGFTISARTTEGKRITFAFMPYRNGGPPQCVDICYHDNGTTRENGGELLPTFNAIGFGDGRTLFDTRKEGGVPAYIVCALMDNAKETT